MKSTFLSTLEEARKNQSKLLAVLIDPDKTDHIDELLGGDQSKISCILVGGSLISKGNVDTTIEQIRKKYKGPIFIFPGDFSQVSELADGVLFLSLISGRNADLLIGKHVQFAPQIKQSGIEVIPCGYILVNSGTPTSVEYMSNTIPIPHNKPDIAAATALAGEMLGMKCMYMESGSGAEHEVSAEMVRQVSSGLQIPLIIGGGIRSRSQVEAAWKAGATMVVIGTIFEEDPSAINSL
jgi:phosphoglycerol geranylgeranyltransferase